MSLGPRLVRNNCFKLVSANPKTDTTAELLPYIESHMLLQFSPRFEVTWHVVPTGRQAPPFRACHAPLGN